MYFSGCAHEVDLVFVLDASGSITEENFAVIREFVRDVINSLNIDSGHVRIGVEGFSDSHYEIFQVKWHILDNILFFLCSGRKTSRSWSKQGQCKEHIWLASLGNHSPIKFSRHDTKPMGTSFCYN